MLLRMDNLHFLRQLIILQKKLKKMYQNLIDKKDFNLLTSEDDVLSQQLQA